MTTIDFKAMEQSGCISCGDWHPLKLEGWLLTWLRHHFATATNIEFDDLKDKVWRSNETTGILIESVGVWLPQLTEKRPGVIIKGHGLQGMQLGLGNRLMGGGGPDAARQVHSTLVTGSHTAFCIGGEYGECRLLAAEVFREILKFSKTTADRLNFARITPPQLGTVAKLEEAKENFGCPVSFGYAFWETWEVTPLTTSVVRINKLTVRQ